MKRDVLEDRLLDYLYDDLESSERDEFERALEGHPDLDEKVRDYGAIRDAARELPAPAVPSAAIDNLLRAARTQAVELREAKEKKSPLAEWFERLAASLMRPSVATAVVFVLVLGTGLVLLREAKHDPTATRSAEPALPSAPAQPGWAGAENDRATAAAPIEPEEAKLAPATEEAKPEAAAAQKQPVDMARERALADGEQYRVALKQEQEREKQGAKAAAERDRAEEAARKQDKVTSRGMLAATLSKSAEKTADLPTKDADPGATETTVDRTLGGEAADAPKDGRLPGAQLTDQLEGDLGEQAEGRGDRTPQVTTTKSTKMRPKKGGAAGRTVGGAAGRTVGGAAGRTVGGAGGLDGLAGLAVDETNEVAAEDTGAVTLDDAKEVAGNGATGVGFYGTGATGGGAGVVAGGTASGRKATGGKKRRTARKAKPKPMVDSLARGEAEPAADFRSGVAPSPKADRAPTGPAPTSAPYAPAAAPPAAMVHGDPRPFPDSVADLEAVSTGKRKRGGGTAHVLSDDSDAPERTSERPSAGSVAPIRTSSVPIDGAEQVFEQEAREEPAPRPEKLEETKKAEKPVEIAKGDAAYDAGRYSDAVTQYRRYLTRDGYSPRSAHALRRLAISYRRLNRLSDALETYETLVARHPATATDGGVLVEMGELQLALGRTATAETTLRRALADPRHSARAQTLLDEISTRRAAEESRSTTRKPARKKSAKKSGKAKASAPRKADGEASDLPVEKPAEPAPPAAE